MLLRGMSGRAIRHSLLLLLAVSAIGSSIALLILERQSTSRIEAYADAAAALAQLSDTVSGIGAAQQAYVAPGQPFSPWFERGSALLEQLPARIDRVRATARAPQAAGALAALAASLDPISSTDARARQNLQLGQDLMAADVVFSDGRSLVEGMMAAIVRVQSAERVDMEASQRSIALGRWITLGIMATLLAIGLVLLSSRRVHDPPIDASAGDAPPAVVTSVRGDLPEEPAQRPDMVAVARLCTELSKLTATTDLTPLLQRALDLLGARGLILWLGVGDSLMPVAARGYRDDAVARMGPVVRSDSSALAEAWRRGDSVSVPGTSSSPGALVMPLLGVDSCVGVLALEVAPGRESDVSTRAIAALFAAQLAPLVSVTPSEGPERALSA
jgi:hypothetical protein